MMKKNFKRALSLGLATLVATTSLVGCGARDTGETSTESSVANTESSVEVEVTETTGPVELAQGVTDTEILIGCTMANSGNYAFIGQPIIDAMQAVFDRVNAQGGILGRNLTLVHYDDQYDAANGQALIEKLVEEDKVFALDALGGNNVGASLDYIKEKGIPAINIVSGLDVCYEESNSNSAIFPIQPANRTDGKFLLARVLHEDVFGPNKDEKLPEDAKIAVFHTIAEGPMTTLEGILEQAEAEGVTDRLIVETVTAATYSTAIENAKAAGASVLISTITDSKGLVAAMDDAGWEVPYVGYYGASTPQSYSPETYNVNRPIYCTTWAEYTQPEAVEMLKDLDDALTYNTNLSAETLESYKNNLYARVGYVAAMTLVEGLKRLEANGDDLTWANYIKAMEEGPFTDMTAYGYYSYADGVRMGVTKLAFTEYVVEDVDGVATGKMLSTRTYETLEEIVSK